MILMHTRISEPLLFSLLKAFYSFFLISLYLDDNYICILVRIELHNSLTFLWPPGRTGTTPSSWSYLPRGNSGIYLKSCPLLRALARRHPYPRWSLSSLPAFFHHSCIHPILAVTAIPVNFSVRVQTIYYSPLDLQCLLWCLT